MHLIFNNCRQILKQNWCDLERFLIGCNIIVYIVDFCVLTCVFVNVFSSSPCFISIQNWKINHYSTQYWLDNAMLISISKNRKKMYFLNSNLVWIINYEISKRTLLRGVTWLIKISRQQQLNNNCNKGVAMGKDIQKWLSNIFYYFLRIHFFLNFHIREHK